MFDNKTILAVIPARGGSKGIPRKNLRKLGGIPLVAIAGTLALQLPEIDRCIVSTDSNEIASVAAEFGIDSPFLRPEAISGDRVSDWAVLNHALQETEKKYGEYYDVIVMLQPTSPLRRAADVSGTIRMLIEGNYDSVWTVSQTDLKSHPLKQLVIHDGLMEYWDPRGAGIIARQQLGSVYHRNGVAYAITRECLLEQKTLKGLRTGANVLSSNQISIDTEEDLTNAETATQRL